LSAKDQVKAKGTREGLRLNFKETARTVVKKDSIAIVSTAQLLFQVGVVLVCCIYIIGIVCVCMCVACVQCRTARRSRWKGHMKITLSITTTSWSMVIRVPMAKGIPRKQMLVFGVCRFRGRT